MEKSITETECTALENLFHQIISNMKMSFPALEDLAGKALKLNAVLRTTITATSAFLEAFHRVANLALGSRGVTSEIGSLLMRLCLRQRAIEDKLKLFAGSILEGLVTPLQDHLEDWKKSVVILDKDHAKESKKAHQDIKKAYSETIRLKKKAKKGKPETSKQLEHAVSEYNEKYEALEVIEKNSVRAALVEEHGHFCFFAQCLKPLMDCEVSMMAEVSHVEQLMAGLQTQAAAPFSFPDTSDCLVPDAEKEFSDGTTKIPEESPRGSKGSRKSSVSSSSSGCIHSPSRSSVSGSVLNSGWKKSDSQDCTDSFAKSSNAQIVSSQSQTSWSGWQDKARTLPITSVSHGMPPPPTPPSLCAESTSTEHQVPYDLSASREPVGVNQYAVPCSISAETTEVCLDAAETYARTSVTGELDMVVQNLRVISSGQEDVKKVPVVPLEGYVNMNQLACLAVQQQELILKKELMLTGDKNACLDALPPPPPQLETSVGTLVTSSSVFKIPASTNSVRRLASGGCSRTAEDIIVSGASRQLNFGAATNRRGSARDRSLPPISRKSSKTAMLPPRNDSAAAFPVSSLSPSSSRRVAEYWKQLEQFNESHMEALPLPPPPNTHRPLFAVDDGSLDNLPLPPPPEELRDAGVCSQLVHKAGSSEIINRRHHGSVTSSHASIIESLNVKFFEQQTLPREAAITSFIRGRRASDAMYIEDARSVDEPLSPGSFAATIQRGVQLRRTVTNDRSAPRLPTNQS